MLKIQVDLDNTICYNRKDNETYADVLPLPGAIETLKELKERGYYIIISTARNMATFSGNVGKVNKHQMPIILEWLKKFDVPYDELYTGKPHVDFFIDDKNIEFNGDWKQVTERLLKEEEKLKGNK